MPRPQSIDVPLRFPDSKSNASASTCFPQSPSPPIITSPIFSRSRSTTSPRYVVIPAVNIPRLTSRSRCGSNSAVPFRSDSSSFGLPRLLLSTIATRPNSVVPFRFSNSNTFEADATLPTADASLFNVDATPPTIHAAPALLPPHGNNRPFSYTSPRCSVVLAVNTPRSRTTYRYGSPKFQSSSFVLPRPLLSTITTCPNSVVPFRFSNSFTTDATLSIADTTPPTFLAAPVLLPPHSSCKPTTSTSAELDLQLPRAKRQCVLDLDLNHHNSDSTVLSFSADPNRPRSTNTIAPVDQTQAALAQTVISSGLNLPVQHLLSSMSQVCSFCAAKRFSEERNSICCANGQVLLPPLQEPPAVLKDLLTDNSVHSAHFKNHIRAYNSSLAFASLGIQEDKLPPGVYSFRIHGAVYHKISPMVPDPGQQPKYAQIYIHDSELANRCDWNSNLKVTVMEELQKMINEINPFSKLYKSAAAHLSVSEGQEAKIKMILKADSAKDSRRYNLPTASEIALIMPGNEDVSVCPRDIIIYRKVEDDPERRHIVHISETNPHYDPLHYVLLFPYGEEGWRTGMPLQVQGRKKEQISPMQFYSYRIMERNYFSAILHGGRLFHQYIVDQYAKVESQRLSYFRANQSKLRSELYQGLADAISAGDTDGSTVGRKTILPSSHIGSPRSMVQLYQDAMSIVRVFGKPDLFITFTCNPSWIEIKRELKSHESSSDRPDIVVRVFKLKMKAFLDDILKKHLFGKVIAFVRVIEFQKRGLPHTHLLLILDENDKPETIEDVDKIVHAEIPDDPVLLELVKNNMMHGPCGVAFPNSPCMKNGVCSKDFPKRFTNQTKQTSTTYPVYRRRDNGKCIEKSAIQLDNRWVVPYNPFLLAKYNAHINVEVCNHVSAVKYLYKYIYKGHDRVMVEFSDSKNQGDEISQYVDARYVSTSEACWRLFHFEMQDRFPSIQRLALHLPNQQYIVYKEGEAQQAVEALRHTTLTAWFELNKVDPEARSFFYYQIPEFYVWDKSNSRWKKRVRNIKAIGRIFTAKPNDERFFLRLLLHHIKGATSFEDLKVLSDGTRCASFKAAAIHIGLLENDEEWTVCLQEASAFVMPKELRQLFVHILLHCDPSDPNSLFTKYEKNFSEDFLFRKFGSIVNETDQQCSAQALLEIKQQLESNGKTLSNFNLPEPDECHIAPVLRQVIYDKENQLRIADERTALLNQEQKTCFDFIMAQIMSQEPVQNLFFIDGPGGTGKTFLYNTILAAVRSCEWLALPMASSGIASELLEGGRTAHSTLKIPIPITDTSTCAISRGSDVARQLEECKVMIWDEAPMTDKMVFECVDRTMRDLLNVDKLFGGKVVILGGDFRQILPVVRHGKEADIINATLKASYMWQSCMIFHLTQNMRAQDDIIFQDWLLQIGNDTVQKKDMHGQNFIELPAEICVPKGDINSLIDSVFRDSSTDVAILTTTNKFVDKVNNAVLNRVLNSEQRTYYSADSLEDSDTAANFPPEFLNSLQLSGIPPHALNLKVGTPVMLLRNLNPKEGLMNGTRLKILTLCERVLECTVVTGRNAGSKVFIPRITLTPSDSELPFILKRRQFPIRACYAMTINKSQGQTLDRIGLYLPDPVFTHGQLYVALSRTKRMSSITACVGENNCTKNVVYHNVL